ncbi:hypothetical protein K3495_g5443 [Podosphaera aphanis]|nr:hypothetical protein K3495_g5443 [Podosphaera aphanis]
MPENVPYSFAPTKNAAHDDNIKQRKTPSEMIEPKPPNSNQKKTKSWAELAFLTQVYNPAKHQFLATRRLLSSRPVEDEYAGRSPKQPVSLAYPVNFSTHCGPRNRRM